MAVLADNTRLSTSLFPGLVMLLTKKNLVQIIEHDICCTKDGASHAAAVHPIQFFSRLPIEIWLQIDELLDGPYRGCFKLSCYTAYTMLPPLPPALTSAGRLRLWRYLFHDWHLFPGHQTCIMCSAQLQQHFAQPRSQTGKSQVPCAVGIRVMPDYILCHSCQTFQVATTNSRVSLSIGAYLWHSHFRLAFRPYQLGLRLDNDTTIRQYLFKVSVLTTPLPDASIL
jgi:hypothetical protein